MSNRSSSERSKAVVDAYYHAGVKGRLGDFAPYVLKSTDAGKTWLPTGTK